MDGCDRLAYVLWVRRVVAAVSFGALILFGFAGSQVWREREFNRCGRTPPGREQIGTGYHLRWGWTPPGWVCVYTNRQSRVVREERR